MLTGLKLLLLEDDEDDYILTRDLLEDLHPGQVQIDWVTSVSEALALLARREHDLCLVDFQLGAENGLELLYRARESFISTPIIMLTGHHEGRLDIEAQHAGAVDYLVKSELNPASLGRSIRYARARHEAESERLQRQQAESESRAKSQFLTHLSHELRTPLASILGYTELLLAAEPEADKLEELRTIERNGQHLLSLLNDVLDLSKIEAGKLDLDPQRIALEPCLADVQSLLEVRAREKAIALNIAAGGDIPESISTDPTRLRQILLNLLGNAIKFTEQGSVDLLVSLAPGNDAAASIVFEVVDTGIGISKADQKAIFEPFIRVENPLAGEREIGSGLGLSISRELAEKLGGSLSCESTPGAGSKFTLTIEAGDITSTPRKRLNLTNRSGAPATSPQIALAGRVLVVDDLSDIRRLLGAILKRAGADVCFATNGREAVQEVLARERTGAAVHAVIMDLQMPVLDGLGALTTLRSGGFHKPVIALTASAMRGERERCLAAGFTEYLGKPIDVTNLLQVLSRYVGAGSSTGAGTENQQKQGSNRTLLLVEDDADARRATSRLINHLGWAVVAAGSAREALARLEQLSSEQTPQSPANTGLPSLALIDLGLPDLDGYELAAQLRAGALHTCRIVALSGATPDPGRLREAGFDAHALKPLGLQELNALLDEHPPASGN